MDPVRRLFVGPLTAAVDVQWVVDELRRRGMTDDEIELALGGIVDSVSSSDSDSVRTPSEQVAHRGTVESRVARVEGVLRKAGLPEDYVPQSPEEWQAILQGRGSGIPTQSAPGGVPDWGSKFAALAQGQQAAPGAVGGVAGALEMVYNSYALGPEAKALIEQYFARLVPGDPGYGLQLVGSGTLPVSGGSGVEQLDWVAQEAGLPGAVSSVLSAFVDSLGG